MKKRKDGRYSRKFYFNGKPYFAYGHSKKELDQKEHRKSIELETGKKDHDDPTVDAFYEAFTDARRGTISPNTIRGQKGEYKVMAAIIIPRLEKRFGLLRLSEVTDEDILILQRTLQEQAPLKVNDYIGHLRYVFKTAVQKHRIPYNPCDPVKNIKRTAELAFDTTHRGLERDEQRAFFAAAKELNSIHINVYRFACSTGVRLGEAGALYTSDIRNGNVIIQRTVTRTESGLYVVGESAKTEAGRRTIPMNDNICQIIADQKVLNKMLYGDKVALLHDRLFRAPEGGLLTATINRDIKKICKYAGIEPFTFHCFRHTFATRALEQGMDLVILSKILGHSKVAITLKYYGHVLDDTKREAMNKLVIEA